MKYLMLNLEPNTESSATEPPAGTVYGDGIIEVNPGPFMNSTDFDQSVEEADALELDDQADG